MAVRERTKNRILAHASKHYADKYTAWMCTSVASYATSMRTPKPSVPPGFDPTRVRGTA